MNIYNRFGEKKLYISKDIFKIKEEIWGFQFVLTD